MKPPKTEHPRKQPVKPGHAQSQLAQSKLIQIEKPIYGGAFLARMEGKAVFVPLTLPGEQVRARITQSKRGYDTADPDEIIAASPDRIAPACPHFGPCGGCHYQHTNYETQLAFKQTILRETLQRGGVTAPAAIDVLAAEPWHYRNRIRLAFDADGNFGYRGRRSNAVIPVRECPIAAPLLVKTAKVITEIAHQFGPTLRPTEISLFCDATESALLASVFIAGTAQFSPAQTKARFDEFARAVHEQIPALKGAELVAEGQAAQLPRTLAQWGEPFLNYRAAGFDYRVDHGAFFQVNRFLVDALVERVAAGEKGSVAWDLYAGVGLFARRLTANFARVVAVESAPSATQALAANLKVTTGTAVRAEILDFLRRNRKAANDPSTRPDLVVVDPPRTGLGPEIISLLVQVAAPALVYVSCDPATLARDLRALTSSGYEIQAITLADLFPQTFHLETVVWLRRA
jgi:23S rRNA (uracil1939-C5)-methyltransferase